MEKTELSAQATKDIRELEVQLRKTHSAVKEFREGFKSEFKKQLLTLVTAAFGLTAALFWNTAIKDTIQHFIPSAETWYWEIATAVIVTIIAVFFIFLLSRFAREEEKNGEKK
ncbi:MAG TPA: DUF5654 family protein [Candidatus Norongarragalinales archaeon]|nr:DUF5654 family protein [Candidatus Norongarragalinales archaeon]